MTTTSQMSQGPHKSGGNDEHVRPANENGPVEVKAVTAVLNQHSSQTATKDQQTAAEPSQNIEKHFQALELQNKTLEDERNYYFEKAKEFLGANKKLRGNYIRYSHIMAKYIQPYASKKNLRYDDKNEDSTDQVLGPLLEDAMEASSLRSQVAMLQKDMLANVEKVHSVSDDQFRLDFGTLASLIKSFSRAIKLPSDTNVSDIDLLYWCPLVRDAQKGYWNTGSRRKSMVEAVIWSVLVDYIFSTPFAMFGMSCHGLSKTFRDLFAVSQQNYGWPVPSELVERWRYTTVEHFVGVMGTENIISPPEGVNGGIEEDLRGLRYTVRQIITHGFAPLSPTTDFSRLDAITDKAVALSLQMNLQRSRYQIVWPLIGDIFQLGKTLNLRSIEESEDVEEGSVAFIVNPGLTKWGDAHGKNLETRLDIAPALVFVESIIKNEGEAASASEGAHGKNLGSRFDIASPIVFIDPTIQNNGVTGSASEGTPDLDGVTFLQEYTLGINAPSVGQGGSAKDLEGINMDFTHTWDNVPSKEGHSAR
jgi:hypothetical protein